MNIRARAARFAQLAGLELKGKITAYGMTAKEIAAQSHHSASAMSRWLAGHVELPMTVLCETCEIIGVEPRDIIDVAYDRLIAELGEPGEHLGELDVAGLPDTDSVPLAAKKGRRKADTEPAE